MLQTLLKKLSLLFKQDNPPTPLNQQDRQFLQNTVSFYRRLSAQDKLQFEQRCLLFLQTVKIIGYQTTIERQDQLLVAAGSVILAWGFDNWHYVNIDEVYLVPSAFNEDSEFGTHDSNTLGVVGSHHLSGKMILSKPALHAGFSNDKDKRNVAIHEFAHLIDMADGDVDGFPERLSEYAYCAPWIAMISKEIDRINDGR